MDTPDLAALAPVLMQQHPDFTWKIADSTDGVLRLELHPQTRPDRLVTIEVNPGAEVYFISFMGSDAGPDFAYNDQDKREVFSTVVNDAVALATGPARIKRRLIDGVEIKLEILLDPDSPRERSLGQSLSNPVSHLKARLRGLRPADEVTDIPSIITD